MFSARFQSFAKAFSRSACRSLSTQSARSASLQISRFASKPVFVFSVPARSFLTSSIARDDSRNYARRQPSEPSEPSDTLFIANLPFIAEEDDVRLAFEKYGPIEQVRVSVGHDGRSKGSALITFGSNEAASSAMEASNESPIYIFDRPTRVEFARSRPGRAPAPPSERLYVRDWQGGENELRAIFGDFEDSIDHIYFAKDKDTGGRSGNVFVNFTSTEAATEALESVVGSSTPDGQPLMVFFARPRTQRGDGGDRDHRPQRRQGGGGGRGQRRSYSRYD